MIYKGKAKIEDGQVICASQLCDECEYRDIFKCVDVEIIEPESKGQEMLLKREEIKLSEGK